MTVSMRLVKAGALIAEARRAVEVWDDTIGPEENFARMVDENLLARPSRSRSKDVVTHGLRPRLGEGQVVPALRELLHVPEAFTQAWAFHTMRAEPLLAQFAGEALYGWYHQGRLSVPTEVVRSWLDTVAPESWGDTMRLRVSQGLRAIARDFGLLVGAHHKEIARPHVSIPAFSYICFELRQSGSSSLGLANHSTWRQFLLSPAEVEVLFATTARTGVFSCAKVGTTWRIDWETDSLLTTVQRAAEHA